MSVVPRDPRLAAYLAERQALLARIVQAIQADPAIDAAWLWGSLGRGPGDALSDLDLWLITATPCPANAPPTLSPYPAMLGQPVLRVLAPQNAPVDGAFLLTLYAGAHGPVQVDWYWQPHAAAAIPRGTTPVLARRNLPVTDQPPHFPGSTAAALEPHAQATNTLHFFWAMVLIATKHLVRRPDHDQRALLRFVWHQYAAVITRTGAPAPPAPTVPPPGNPAASLTLLRAWTATIAPLLPQAASDGLVVPVGIEPLAEQYFDLAERWLRTAADRP